MIDQREFNRLVNAEKARLERNRRKALEQLAAIMFARGYRAEELIVFHHEGEIQACLYNGIGLEQTWVVTDSTRIYLGARVPIRESRLRHRRLWRSFRPYLDASLDRIQVKEFPLD